MTFTLRFTNPHGDRFYLAELGDTWPHRPGVRFVQRTVTDPREAMVFGSAADAQECLSHKMAAPPGWEVVAQRDASEPGNTADVGHRGH